VLEEAGFRVTTGPMLDVEGGYLYAVRPTL
jgi:hypothetical protein